MERIPLLMNFISPWAATSEEWDFLTMSLYSYLDWANFREQLDISAYPDMKNFLEKFKHSPGVEETKIVVI